MKERGEAFCSVGKRRICESTAETDALIANYFLHTCTEFADVRNCHIYMDVVMCRLNSYFPTANARFPVKQIDRAKKEWDTGIE